MIKERSDAQKMKIAVFGYHNIGYRCLLELVKMGENVCALFTHKDNPDENIWFETPNKVAQQYNIPCYYPENVNIEKWISVIKDLKPDIIFSFYYRNLISQEILNIPPMGAINLHGSYLPKYRGRCPVNWVIINGETATGVTLHYMVSKPDAGDIIGQKKIPIDIEDTAYTLFKKLEDAAVELFREVFPLIKTGKNQRIKQDESQASYFGGRKPEDGLIDWTKPAIEIYNLIRGVTYPFPGAFTYYQHKKLIIWESKLIPGVNLSPGEIEVIDKKIIVHTGNGKLSLTSCQFEGGKKLTDKDFINHTQFER